MTIHHIYIYTHTHTIQISLIWDLHSLDGFFWTIQQCTRRQKPLHTHISTLWYWSQKIFSHPLHMSQDRSSLLAWTNFSITDNTRMQSFLGHDSQCMALPSAERSLSTACLVEIWGRDSFLFNSRPIIVFNVKLSVIKATTSKTMRHVK